MRVRLELAVEADPTSLLDRSDIAQAADRLQAQLSPFQWALLELLALEVVRVGSVDRETRRVVLRLPHRTE